MGPGVIDLRMNERAWALADRYAGLTADLGNAPVGDTGARSRLVALAEMASGLGWSEVERIALTALRRWAVAGVAA